MSSEEDDTYPKSPHKYPSLMDCQQFPSVGSICLEDLSFPAAALSPLVDLEAFSVENPVPPFLSKTYDLVDDRTLDPNNFVGFHRGEFRGVGPSGVRQACSASEFQAQQFLQFCPTTQYLSDEGILFLYDLGMESFIGAGSCLHHVQGFHKIDNDRWEFANESFRRGEKHLLKNIHRRRSTQSQQVGSHTGSLTEAGRSGLESDVERLRKERSVMMQEVIELQQQQSGTVHHVQSVNQRLQAAEQRQKQMVSFLAKLFQNPAFLARLKQKKEQGEIGSSRMRRKFVKHQQHQHALSESSMENKIMKYIPDWRNITLSSVVPDTSPVSTDQSPDHVSEGTGLGSETMPLLEIVAPDEFAISDELGVGQGFIKTPEQVGEGQSSMQFEDPNLKGKIFMNPAK
ncbi:hypothetical protein OIU84_010964 [Salix udensis]|uniref:HSF-type DNA-binding domain-containing protein n=1 Tax=Salix udensis TaxID=889485 RepID=A0AAD6JM10_9ROSI|nr:hypothetical protein OIU84_010964 [Salix udensis]